MAKLKIYPVHWVSSMFAPLTPTQYSDLKNRIKETGQTSAAILWKDKSNGKTWIIDGAHRQKIAQELGRKLRVDVRRKNQTEIELLDIALDAQFTGRGGDSTYAACEALNVIDVAAAYGIRLTQKELLTRFSSRLNKTSLARANIIKRVRPVWFNQLRYGQPVDTGKFITGSLKTLAKICKEEEKMAPSNAQDYEQWKKDSIKHRVIKHEIESLKQSAQTLGVDTNWVISEVCEIFSKRQ